MPLKLFSGEYRLAQSSAGDLVLVACIFAAALTYLEVPFWNALLFGPAITFQAAVGVVVLTRLLKGVPGSLLLLMGPGLILGGALSFAVFQLVGRGAFGLIAVLALGVSAVATLIKATAWQPLSTSRKWTIGQILGLAALALTWEFPELLPVALAFFIFGFFTRDTYGVPRWLMWTIGPLVTGAMATVPLLRQDYWWGVTDDYNFLETVSQHLARSGPFADWGVLNFSRYHWLPYGWSGLLNELGGRPAIFTTLSRVMPFVYSASLAASLILVLEKVQRGSKRPAFFVIPAWAVLAINRLDWSGTGTAGIYAVLAATVGAVILVLNTAQEFKRRIGVYLGFVAVATLTKLPSIIAVVLLLLLCETTVFTKRLKAQLQFTANLVTATIGVFLSVSLLNIFSQTIGRFEVVKVNPGLGQLAELGSQFAMYALSIKHFVLLVCLTALLSLVLLDILAIKSRGSMTLLHSFIPLVSLGVLFDIKISGNANTHEYFSGPNYFLGSLALLSPLTLRQDTHKPAIKIRIIFVLAISLTTMGVLWTKLSLYGPTWRILGERILNLSGAEISVMQFFSMDMRIGATIGVLLCLPILCLSRVRGSLFVSLLISIVVLTLYEYSQVALEEITRTRSLEEVYTYLGSPEIQAAGDWIRRETGQHDLIATDYMFKQGTGRAYSDYALAAWSSREYLVMDIYGPWFDLNFAPHVAAQNAVSLLATDSDSLNDLKNYGVKWLVLDRQNIDETVRSEEWTIAYANSRFFIVKL